MSLCNTTVNNLQVLLDMSIKLVSAGILTFCAESRAGCEAGHIDYLYSELLARVPVDAAPDHAEGTPETHTSQIHQNHLKTHLNQSPCGAFCDFNNATHKLM